MFIELTDSSTTVFMRAIESVTPHGGYECVLRTISGQAYRLAASAEYTTDAVLRGTPLTVGGQLIRSDEAPKRRGKSVA